VKKLEHKCTPKPKISQFNRGINEAFGIGLFVFRTEGAIAEIYGKNGTPTVVSIGSGNGNIETYFMNVKMILIDPNPESFLASHGVSIYPQYGTTGELVASGLNVSNCVLFLIWTTPDGIGEKNPYDIEAIQLLNPLLVVILYERFHDTGAAGSSDLHNSVRCWDNNEKDEFGLIYFLYKSYSLEPGIYCQFRMDYYVRNDGTREIPPNPIEYVEPVNPNAVDVNNDDCSIM
jgi:hypothetical protein